MARLQPVPALLTPPHTRGDPLCLLIHGLDLGDEIPCSGAASPDCPVGKRPRGRVGRQERGLTLEKILLVGIRNERE